MRAEKDVAAQVLSIDADPIFIAIEMNRSKRLVGRRLPASTQVGIHTMDWR
jgi:hypothetical protein